MLVVGPSRFERQLARLSRRGMACAPRPGGGGEVDDEPGRGPGQTGQQRVGELVGDHEGDRRGEERPQQRRQHRRPRADGNAGAVQEPVDREHQPDGDDRLGGAGSGDAVRAHRDDEGAGQADEPGQLGDEDGTGSPQRDEEVGRELEEDAGGAEDRQPDQGAAAPDHLSP